MLNHLSTTKEEVITAFSRRKKSVVGSEATKRVFKLSDFSLKQVISFYLVPLKEKCIFLIS